MDRRAFVEGGVGAGLAALGMKGETKVAACQDAILEALRECRRNPWYPTGYLGDNYSAHRSSAQFGASVRVVQYQCTFPEEGKSQTWLYLDAKDVPEARCYLAAYESLCADESIPEPQSLTLTVRKERR